MPVSYAATLDRVKQDKITACSPKHPSPMTTRFPRPRISGETILSAGKASDFDG